MKQKDNKDANKQMHRAAIARAAALAVLLAAATLCAACAKIEPAAIELNRAEIVYVVDGDTLCVQTDSVQGPQKVRLVGINTPESAAPEEYLAETGKENTREGVDASEFVKDMLHEGDTVLLQYDEERVDKYGRLLAYVWVQEPDDASDIGEVSSKMLNAILLRDGYAETMSIRPNTAYKQMFETIANSR